jgi:peptide/nickel transport system substrate-binding protein/oligopeptide transport system substrate-binding protein
VALPVLLVGLLAAAGCTHRADSAQERDGTEAQPVPGGSLHMMFEAPGTLDPSLADDVYEACIINQLYDGLLEFDMNLNPVPAVAREWSVSRDGLEYRFVLRDDVFFHNGRKVVADDFVWSFRHIFDPERSGHGLGGEYLQRIAGVKEYVAGESDRIGGLVAENDTTLVIRLSEPYGSFLSVLAMDQTKVVAREAFADGEEAYDLHPVGTGPFVFDHFLDDPDDPQLVLRANPRFHGHGPWVERLVFHVPSDYNVDKGAEALLGGMLSFCDLPGDRKAQVELDPRFEVIRRPELSFSFVGMNLEKTPFQDVRIRRAVAHAVNRTRMVAVDPGGRIPAVGILPPGMFAYSPEEKTLAYDPDLSRSLLAEAGYPGGKGLPPVLHVQADRGETGRVADEILREDLAAVGIDVKFRYTEWDTFSHDLDGYRLPSFGLTWVADVPDPDSFLASLFSTRGVYNLFRYSNPTVDELLAEGSRMRSSQDRASLYRRSERIILNDVPMVPLFHIANNFAVRHEVEGLMVTPFGYGNLRLERVWIDSPAS